MFPLAPSSAPAPNNVRATGASSDATNPRSAPVPAVVASIVVLMLSFENKGNAAEDTRIARSVIDCPRHVHQMVPVMG